MVVAFVEVETPQDRMFRQAATAASVDDVLAEADKPDADGRSFAVAAVYRTNAVAEDAKCEVCGIGIRDLQATLDTLRGV